MCFFSFARFSSPFYFSTHPSFSVSPSAFLFGLAFLRRRTFSPICVSSFRNIDSACYGFVLVREQRRLFYFDSKFTPSKGLSVEDWALAIIVSLKKKKTPSLTMDNMRCVHVLALAAANPFFSIFFDPTRSLPPYP